MSNYTSTRDGEKWWWESHKAMDGSLEPVVGKHIKSTPKLNGQNGLDRVAIGYLQNLPNLLWFYLFTRAVYWCFIHNPG